MNEKLKELVHYGKILKDEEFNFKSDGIFIRMTVFEMDKKKYLTFRRNGECVSIEEL